MDHFELDSNLKPYYTSTKKEPFFVTVPQMHYLTFSGVGHPSEADFQNACEALFTLSYIIKFEISRKKLNIDYKVSPMEVTWFLDKTRLKTEYSWTMMIRQPKFITREILQQAIDISKEKGKNIESARVAYESLEFGKCVQCFHRGDYNKMNDTLKKMIAFADDNGFDCDQYTHDIYLNDMRKTKVDNYKTIMRIKIYNR